MKVLSAAFVAAATDPRRFPKSPWPEVAFAGRSNVGKSSLLNSLFGRKGLAKTSNTPGRTQSINFYQVNERFHLVDLPGYGFAKVPKVLREAWGPMIERYLTGRRQLRGVVQLIDARHAPTEMDLGFYDWLEEQAVPHMLVATKADKLSANELARQRKAILERVGASPDALFIFSAKTGKGRDQVWRGVRDLLALPERDIE